MNINNCGNKSIETKNLRTERECKYDINVKMQAMYIKHCILCFLVIILLIKKVDTYYQLLDLLFLAYYNIIKTQNNHFPPSILTIVRECLKMRCTLLNIMRGLRIMYLKTLFTVISVGGGQWTACKFVRVQISVPPTLIWEEATPSQFKVIFYEKGYPFSDIPKDK